ncbi:hypothetical protein K432DRAFT_445415 [Lepidopterella palustris CBS 459.81]|uniref:Uncharacterized protein n=1 Tax=Lepidopterella palustris CBS 459.81 TaxID=1314670 RepID=A0A8E2JCG5_9PEZI|nr:hypothetical protein K432DRAFT_445415 [Lepidopterella palustris CBS 459.81]
MSCPKSWQLVFSCATRDISPSRGFRGHCHRHFLPTIVWHEWLQKNEQMAPHMRSLI